MRSTNANRVALVTGASRGLGAVIARLLMGEGYALIVTARGREALGQVAESLKPFNRQVIALPGDVSDAAHRRALVDAARRLGRLDAVINNASDLGPSPLLALADFPLDELARVFSINIIAPVGLIQEALPLLKASHGLVVNISSDAALGGYERWGGYGASKAALDLITKTLANELRDDGVSVVSVDPGEMRTEMLQAGYAGEDISDRPLPDVTLPFWAWLFGQDWQRISGERFQAQSDVWEARDETR